MPRQVGLEELGNRPLRVLVMPLRLPAGAVDLDKGGAEAAWLGAMARRVAKAIGSDVEIRVVQEGEAEPGTAFRSADLVVSPLCGKDLESWRVSARLVPFWPMPGSPPLGPAVAW